MLYITPNTASDTRGWLLRLTIFPMMLFGILIGGYSKSALAADAANANPDMCQSYQDKFDAAVKDCDLERIVSLGETGKQSGYNCVPDMMAKALTAYYSKCFKSKLDQKLADCDLDAIGREETLVNTKLKNQAGYAVMREMLKQAKCTTYPENCLNKVLKDAIAHDDWNSILKMEDTVNAEGLKSCSNYPKLSRLVKEAKGDYFKQQVMKKLNEAIKSRDLWEIYQLENFVYRDLQDAIDYQDLLQEFLQLKCQKLDGILNFILKKAIEDCDANKILEIEDLLMYKWKKNCLGYDYPAMENRILQTKQAYLERCVTSGLKACIEHCDLGRILEMDRLVASLPAQAADRQGEILAGKCHDLAGCLQEDLKYAIKTCNNDRFQEIEALLNSAIFIKCDNRPTLLGILKQQQQAFLQECIEKPKKADVAAKTEPADQNIPSSKSAQDVSPAKTEQNVPPANSVIVSAVPPPPNVIIDAVRLVIDKYKSLPPGQPPIEDINRILCKKFEDAVLYPPALGTKRTGKFVSVLKTALSVQEELPYENYLDKLMPELAIKVFVSQENKDKGKNKTKDKDKTDDLKRMVDLFKSMDKEFREAVFEVNNPQVTYKVYTKFYFPLIKIRGFLNNVYEYGDQKPYESLVARLDGKQREASFKDLQKVLETAGAISTDDALNKLLTYYYHARDKNIWEYADTALNKESSMPALVSILQADTAKETGQQNLSPEIAWVVNPPRKGAPSAAEALIKKYLSTRNTRPSIEDIDRILCKEFEDNILHPPLLAKDLTSAKRKENFINLIKTALSVQEDLSYRNYLDRLIPELAAKTFGVEEYKERIMLSPSGLKRVEELFKGMDKEFREAIFEVNNPEVIYKVFTKFYFPLIKINGFLNDVYEYGNQRPYESFVAKLDGRQQEASFKDLQKILGGMDFISAEDALGRLLAYYYHVRNKNIWEYADVSLNKNLNIAVLVNMLMKSVGSADSDKNYKYDEILTMLLERLDDPKYLIKQIDPDTRKIIYYDNTVFFNFIYYGLLIPIELGRYPLRDENGSAIPIKSLITAQNKISIGPELKVTGRDKVDGRFRQIFCSKILHINPLQSQNMQNTSEQISTGVLFKKMRQQFGDYFDKAVSATILLPNSPYNNAGSNADTDKYNATKRQLFIGLKKFMEDSQNQAELADSLKFALRLSLSYRSGDMQLPFYIVATDTYRKYFGRLDDGGKLELLFERLKLGLSAKKLTDKNNVKILLNDVNITNEDLLKTYKITPQNVGTIYEAAASRSAAPGLDWKIGRIPDLRQDETVFLLLKNLGNMAAVLNNSQKELPLDIDEARSAYQSISNIMDVYNFNLPVLGNIDPALVTGNQNAVAMLISLSNDKVKQPFAAFNDTYAGQDKFPADKTVTYYRGRIATKMIMHNFLMWETLFKAIESNKYDFLDTAMELDYEFTDFDLLIPVTQNEKLNAHEFAEDTCAGFSLNPAFLKGADDDLFYQYFFSPITSNATPKDASKSRINSFDDVIRKILNPELQDLPSQISATLEKFIHDQTDGFSQIYNKFNSVFSIQKIWESMLSRIEQEASNQDNPAFRRYQDFYLKGNFINEDSNSPGFREDIVGEFSKKFYSGYSETENLDAYLANYYKLCSGSESGNLGLKGMIDKYKSSNLDFAKVYRKAAVSLMPQVFEGKGLEEGQHYLGQMFYDNQKQKAKPVPSADMYSDNFYHVYEWIWECAYKLAKYPELRGIFVEDEVWKANGEKQ